MAMQLTIGSSSSSSSSLEVASKKFDVFISFRGEDTRSKFTSHLNEALKKSGVRTFIDDSELEKGDEISSTLIKAIEESDASIVVFSKDYASSKWCLNELVKILKCKKDHGQIVIPIFYEIEPSHVRNQIGSYKQAFAKHKQNLKHNKDKLQKWKDALTEAATLSGWDSKNSRVESVFIKDIVEDVLKKFHRRHPFEVNKELVGIENKHQEIESLLRIGSNDVRVLALWGMGGIGKTTLAKSLYAKHCSQFERHCFLENVRGVSTSCRLNVVRHNLFSTLFELRPDAPFVENPIFTRKLACERSLIVLDDVATTEQAENLNIVNDCLGPGSRVIVTTRDKQICTQFDECEIYEVKGLNRDDSLQLFCWNAFRKEHAEVGYEWLSLSAIFYCSGNPLALKVLGATLRKKSKEEWKSELDKLKMIPNGRIQDVLKLSFDDLDRTLQYMFLDIACFFHTKINNFDYYSQREYIKDLFNACKFHPTTGIEDLLRKALITSEINGDINMHELLVDMGREIVRLESPKDPGRRSRLWDPEEVYDVFKYNKGTKFVEVIMFETTDIKEDLYLSTNFFRSMINLRSLHIINRWVRPERFNKVHLLDGLEWLPDKLRHLCWDQFPLESLPSSTFCAQKLVHLRMTFSKLKQLWDGIQKLDNLTIIILDDSEDLIEIPDLSRAPNLKILSLKYCASLRQLHPSIFTAPKLRELLLEGCKKIESLKTNIHSKSLQKLDLTHCSSLVEFSVTSEEMTWLSLCGTAIHEFPSSIWGNSKLTFLNLSECKKLNIVGKELSNDPGLESLTELHLSGCSQINTLSMWFNLDGMRSLENLNLGNCCNLEALADNIQNCLMLKWLNLDDCRNLKSLPKLPASLRGLTAKNCSYLDTNSIQREILDNMLYRLPDINNYDPGLGFFAILPGSEVPCEFDFYTTEASIVFPPIPKLSDFVLYVILSEGLNLTSSDEVWCTANNHGKPITGLVISCEKLISDHVLLIYFGLYSWVDNDHDSLSFEFEVRHYVDGVEKCSTKGIKGCGIIPVVYGLDGSSSSRSKVEIVELPFNAQVSENEDAQQQQLIIPKEKEEDLNDKSFCDCLIGLLLKHLLEESKRLFLSVFSSKRIKTKS